MGEILRLDKNSKRLNLNFNEFDYKNIDYIVRKNPGLTIEEYVKLFDFYNFTNETLEYSFKLFNTYPNSFYGICGPFVCNEGKWFSINDIKKNQKLNKENITLKNEISILRNMLSNLNYKKNL